ncbi:MAG: peptidoglycan DD-metalloendopeptidase family protein [Rhizobiaceae bacterium]
MRRLVQTGPMRLDGRMRLATPSLVIRSAVGLCAAGAAAISLTFPVTAQEPATVASKSQQRSQSSGELDALLKATTLSQERIEQLDAEIAELKRDETAVTAALIQSGKTQRKLTEDIARIETRLEAQLEAEKAIRASLKERRAILAEVLGALQRMGLNPPPAILVKPDDALSSVRSAILLGAVVPQMRGETERLIADLDALKRVSTSITNERASLLKVLQVQTEERHRLDALVAEKQRLRAQTETSRTFEKKNAANLANKAKTLKDLISALEKDIAAEQNAMERKRREEEKRLALERQQAETQVAMLSPGLSLSQLKRSLILPVSGKIIRPFGAPDGFGGKTAGVAVAAAPNSLVSTPVDATVLYAGPFRSYHQLLILDAGDAYHVVLGGMDKIMVSTGQFVLSGEPVGIMATKAPSNSPDSPDGQAALTDGTELYIEFRKDGAPIDSAAWWAAETAGRTGNDT